MQSADSKKEWFDGVLLEVAIMKFADEALLQKARVVGQELLRKMRAEELAPAKNVASVPTVVKPTSSKPGSSKGQIRTVESVG